MKNNSFFILVFLLCSMLAHAQDTLMVFSPEQFISIVRANHPMVKQYNLLSVKGDKTILRENGNFDPYLFSDLDQKYFSDKQYYHLWSSGLKVPTWFGADFKLGVDQSAGQYVNEESKLPNSGLVYLGVSMPLLQGFWINERRTVVKQANIFARSSEAEQRNLINDLIFNALATYWEWYNAHQKFNVYVSAVKVAQLRFEGVKASYVLGDRSAIDTLESFIQLQNRILNLNQAAIEKKNAALELSNYLWNTAEEPLEIQSNLLPIERTMFVQQSFVLPDSLNESSKQLALRHPAVNMYHYKYEIAALDKKWKQEKLKPKLNVNYNLLTQPVGSSWVSNFSSNNYKWGVDFSFPVFLRKERGDVQLADIKMQEIDYSRDQKILEQSNKIEQYKNELKVLQQQTMLFAQMVKNYEALLQAEQRNFDVGESSLFMVNAREMALIDAHLKQIEVQAKCSKSKAGIFWAIGLLK